MKIFLFRSMVMIVLMCMSFSTYALWPVIDVTSIAQLIQQLSQLKQQTEYIQQQIKQLNGNQYQWSNSQGLINNLGSIVGQTKGIAYNASNINEKFQQAYPGYQAPQNFNQQYKNNVNATEGTLNGVLQSMGSSARDFQNENERLAFLQRQSQNAKGQTQAIQALTQITSEMVSQIQLLRQTIIAQSNAQIAYYATQVQNEASAKAELEKMITSGSTNVPRYGTSGHELHLPNF